MQPRVPARPSADVASAPSPTRWRHRLLSYLLLGPFLLVAIVGVPLLWLAMKARRRKASALPAAR